MAPDFFVLATKRGVSKDHIGEIDVQELFCCFQLAQIQNFPGQLFVYYAALASLLPVVGWWVTVDFDSKYKIFLW